MNLQEKYNSLRRSVKKLNRVVVAYSGGVDSTLLLKVAVDTLEAENVLACIAAGPSLAKADHRRAMEMAELIGVKLRTVSSRPSASPSEGRASEGRDEPNELADTAYSANKADRCFHCKVHLYRILTRIAGENDFDCIICGCNFDDKDDFRPGSRAAENFDVRCPLTEAKLTKEDIRQLSRKLGLPTADISASPCLASRISYGLEITEQRLKQIEEAEEFLRTLGLVEFRVRLHDAGIGRIEVHAEDMERITTEPSRSRIVKKLKSLGFKFISVDLQGFRSGSLNELLTEEQKRKSL